MTRCVNIDWLEVYCLEDYRHTPCDAEFFRSHGWSVIERPYGTRIYEQMFTLLDQRGEGFIEIRRAPYSLNTANGGFFEPTGCHIRLCNRTCYANSPIDLLREFLVRYNYELRKISRIDICMDFIKFDSGDHVPTFIHRYLKGVYTKINQTNVSAHGTDTWEGRVFNSLSWGKSKSMISTKLYCKTLELQQVHDKPYIRYAWRDAGLIFDPVRCTALDENDCVYKPDIYRLEFSIKAGSARYFVVENENGKRKKREFFPNTLDVYDTKEKLFRVFASLTYHYFHFKHFDPSQRKDRCKDKVLFRFRADDTCLHLEQLAASTSPSTLCQRISKLLDRLTANSIDNNIITAAQRLTDLLLEYQVRTEVDVNALQKEVLAMQILLSRRFAGEHNPDITKMMSEIKTQLDLFDDVF